VLVGKELDVVAAVVLGGASLMGGVGTVLGTFLGFALLAICKMDSSCWAFRPTGRRFFVGWSFSSRFRRRPGRSASDEPEGAPMSQAPVMTFAGVWPVWPAAERLPRSPCCCLHSGRCSRLPSAIGFFSVNTLQSMAFQMPELGILSLCDDAGAAVGGLNLSIIATANLGRTGPSPSC